MDINALAQLIGVMSDAVSTLETALLKKDKIKSEKAKKLILNIQTQIQEELK